MSTLSDLLSLLGLSPSYSYMLVLAYEVLSMLAYGRTMIEFVADRPVWKQVADILRERIRNGTYRPRQPIPSETQLVGEFGIARGTARTCRSELSTRGTWRACFRRAQ